MAIISGGELVLSDANSPWVYRSNYMVPAGLDLSAKFASYGAIYKAQGNVYVLVRKRALATKRLPLKVYRRVADGREDAGATPYGRLLARPNPKHSAKFLWEWTSSTFDIYGEAIWLKVRGRDGLPAELWPIHPTNIRIEKRDGEQIYVYGPGVLSGSDPQYVIPAADVVHFRSFNPDTTVRGLSPLEPLRASLVNDDAARRAQAAFWDNGARPSMFLSHPGSLTQAGIDRLKGQWDSIHGGVDNFGKTAVLEEGMEPKVLSLSAEEAQYIESRKLAREEACMVYDTPPPVVHILDHATFSNITEQMRSMYRDTMAPHLGGFEDVLDHQLAPDFDDGLYAEFLMDEVLRGDFEVRTTAYQAAINTGWMTPAEVRAKENLPFIEGSDQLFINAAVIPIDEVSSRTSPNAPAMLPAQEAPPPPLPPSGDEGPGSKALRVVMGRTSRAASLADIDVAALTEGLNGSTKTVTDALAAAVAEGDDVAGFRRRVRVALGG